MYEDFFGATEQLVGGGVSNDRRSRLGILIREVTRKQSMVTGRANAVAALCVWLERAERIRTQQRKDKNKLNALHAQAAECIAKVSCAVG